MHTHNVLLINTKVNTPIKNFYYPKHCFLALSCFLISLAPLQANTLNILPSNQNEQKLKLSLHAKKDKTEVKSKTPTEDVKPKPIPADTINVACEDLVKDPKTYLNKHIRFKTKFYAFSNLALDYKPAFKSSKDYLSLLVLKSDSHTPLSELKLAMLIPKEKHPDNKVLASLKDGDKIEIVGTEFSTALGDPWVDVISLKRLEPPKPDKDKDDKEVSSSHDIDKTKSIKEKNDDKFPPEINNNNKHKK